MQSPKVLFALAGAGVLAVGATFVAFVLTALPEAVATSLFAVGSAFAIYGTVMGVVRLRERKADELS